MTELHADNDSYTPSLYQVSTTDSLGVGQSVQVTVVMSTASNTPNRPPGARTVFSTDADPAIPSIYQLAVPAGVAATGATVPTTIGIPFQVLTNNVSGDAPLGPLTALGIYTTSGDDIQGDLSTAYHAFAVFTALEKAV